MNLEQARLLVERQARAWESADIEACVADFATDAEFISPGGRWHGQAAIRAVVEAYFKGAGGVKVTVTRVMVDGDQGALEWTWSETRFGDNKRHTAEDAIIFVVRDGKIIYWREYFDMASF